MGNNPSRVTAQDKAILDLKTQRDKLHQYQRRITILTDRETQIAKQMLAQGDRKKALLALRRKKYQESLLSKTDSQLEQLESLTSNVEFAKIQKDIVFGLQQGTKVLKEIHTEMGGIDHVEKLMGETAEAVAYQKEVSEMLGDKISNQDEDEVELELEALEKQVRNTQQEGLPTLPGVPNKDFFTHEAEAESEREAESDPRPAQINHGAQQAMLA